MRLRNNIFAAAFDYLKRNTDIKTQKELARRMGVTENTITRILKDYTEVTEDIITKLQTASGCIFNLQWLRGEDSTHMLAEDVHKEAHQQPLTNSQPDYIKDLLAAKDQMIQELRDKYNKMEEEKNARIAILEKLAEERFHQIVRLQRIIDANKLNDGLLPVGVATYK
jgi:transcriptional regulator with XRE-family HTH domain